MDNYQASNQNQDRNKTKEFEAKFKNYAGPDGVTVQQLEIGLWFVEHKELLRKILYGFLILISAVSWTYTLYGFAYYFTRGINEDQVLVKQLVEANSIGHDYISQISAKELAVSSVGVLKSSVGKYDFYAQIKNNNEKWWAEFDYYFMAAGHQTKKSHGYIFPFEEKYFSLLAEDFSDSPASAALFMENFKWRRIDQHKIADWDDYYKKHVAILSSDIKFTPADESPLSEKLNLNQLSFSATNGTVFNYWEVAFTILFYQGGNLVNINHYSLDNFMSGQKRSVEINWSGDIGRVDRIEIVPEVNIMKDDIYIKYEGGVGEEK